MNDSLKMTGSLRAVVTNSDGVVVQEQEIKNLVVTTGLNYVASRMKDASATAMSHMAVGTTATAASAGQTALVAEAARVAATSTVTANSIAYVASFPAGTGTGTLVEAGIFNDPTAGTMLSRTASINVVKGALDTLTITWTLTVS